MEAVTLHRRFPYAVLAGFFFLDKDSNSDETKRRRSTFVNAHSRFRLFTGRDDPSGRDEQYERLYLVLMDANQFLPVSKVYQVGEHNKELTFGQVLNELVQLVADRNPDFYECIDGAIQRATS